MRCMASPGLSTDTVLGGRAARDRALLRIRLSVVRETCARSCTTGSRMCQLHELRGRVLAGGFVVSSAERFGGAPSGYPGPPRIVSLWLQSGAFVPDCSHKEVSSGAASPPPNPHRVTRVNY